MYHYKSGYIQKGHGLGGLFRGIRNFFAPLARKVVTTLNRPEVKRVLKTIGKESVNTGSELLVDSIRGNDIQATLNKRIGIAKKRIAESIKDGVNSQRKANNTKRYHHLRNNSPESDNYENLERIRKSTQSDKVNKLINKRMKPKGKFRTIRRSHRTVFD
jgi:hypothetical protein